MSKEIQQVSHISRREFLKGPFCAVVDQTFYKSAE